MIDPDDVPLGLVAMFHDLVAASRDDGDVPIREVVELFNDELIMQLAMPMAGMAYGGTMPGWFVGVGGTSEGEGIEVVVVRDGSERPAGFGAVFGKIEGETIEVVSPMLVLFGGEGSMFCFVSEVEPEEVNQVMSLLVRAAVGTILAWTPPNEGGMLH